MAGRATEQFHNKDVATEWTCAMTTETEAGWAVIIPCANKNPGGAQFKPV